MVRLLFYFLGALASTLILVLYGGTSTIGALCGGFLTGIIVPLIDQAIANYGQIRFRIQSALLRETPVRISASYLYRIKIDRDYLLIRGSRYTGQFQPVGGVFKMLPEGRIHLRTIGASDDDLIPLDDSSRDDLRIRVPGKRLPDFIQWYQSKAGRESDAWREFHEELLKSGILDSGVFPFVFSRHIRQVQNPIRFSSYAQSKELLIADIYELLPTPDQLEALKELKRAGHHKIIWATEEQILRRGASPGQTEHPHIAMTAEWTIAL